jgi:hypothetical protein
MCRHYDFLTKTSGALKRKEDPRWDDSPFGWLKRVSPGEVGSFGEKMAMGWLNELGLHTVRWIGSEADLLTGVHKLEVKLSVRWDRGIYSFGQIRDQDYDFALLIGVSFHAAHAWIIPKAILMHGWENTEQTFPRSQHTGENGKETAWLQFHPPGDPMTKPYWAYPEWIEPWGGSLPEAACAAKSLLTTGKLQLPLPFGEDERQIDFGF